MISEYCSEGNSACNTVIRKRGGKILHLSMGCKGKTSCQMHVKGTELQLYPRMHLEKWYFANSLQKTLKMVDLADLIARLETMNPFATVAALLRKPAVIYPSWTKTSGILHTCPISMKVEFITCHFQCWIYRSKLLTCFWSSRLKPLPVQNLQKIKIIK